MVFFSLLVKGLSGFKTKVFLAKHLLDILTVKVTICFLTT